MKRTIAIIALQSTLLIASGDDTRWHLGKEGVKKAKEAINQGLDRVQVIQGTLPATAGDAGHEFGKNAVNGAVEAAGQKVKEGQQYLYGVAAAALATPAAPFVIAAGVGVLALGTAAKCTSDYRKGEFRRCLNTNFAGDLNQRGFPQRCESPERKFAWWQQEKSVKIIEHYRGQRRMAQKITNGVIYK